MVIIAVVVATLVIVPVVLGFVMYTMVSGQIGSSYDGEPIIQLGDPESLPNNEWDILVAGVSSAKALDGFRAALLKDGTLLDELDLYWKQVSTHMNFTDLGGEGDLSSGDSFRITCDPGSYYQFFIIWKDSGNSRGEVDWYT